MIMFQHAEVVPSDITISCSESTNIIRNNPITRRDVLASLGMLGRRKNAAQGKITCTQSDAVNVTIQKIYFLRIIHHFCNNVELSVDAMLVNNVPFLTIISEHIHYGIVNAVVNLKCHALETQAKGLLRSHVVSDFRIIIIGNDTQFKALKERTNCDVSFNAVHREEHGIKIERWNMVVKECRRFY